MTPQHHPPAQMSARGEVRYGSMWVVPALAPGWAERSDPQRIELYTRWSFYLTLAACPLLAVMGLGASPSIEPLPAALVLVGSVAVSAAALLLARAGLAGRADARPLPPRLLAVAVVLAVVTAGAGVAVFSAEEDSVALPWCVALPVAVVLIACATAWPARTLAVAGAGGGALVGLAVLVDGQDAGKALVLAVLFGFVIASIAQSFRFSVWVLDVVEELERAREVQSRLAVAEERLRFARDLHDVMGRNLSAIAVKGQLAGELARRGRAEAADELADISRLAEESLREVRGVVGGYRSADLPGELAGARSVLRAAGVACVVTGEADGAGLPLAVQSALGWVVREAVTNVLRHSRATSCSIDLRTAAGTAELCVANDGLPAAGAPDQVAPGNGLTGLDERLSVAGGRLTAGRKNGQFVLAATLPTEPAS